MVRAYKQYRRGGGRGRARAGARRKAGRAAVVAGRRSMFRRRGRGLRSLTGLMGQPSRKLVRMRYTESLQIAPAAFSTAVYFFSANNIFDPNVTGTGHQPRGHDQWAAFYNHYVVIGSVCKVYFDASIAKNDTGVNHAIAVGVMLNDDTTSTGGPVENKENNWCKTRYINNNENPRTVISQKFNNKRLGVTKPLSDDKVKASFGASPAEQAYYEVMVQDLTNTTVAIGPVQCTVEIEYIVVLIEPKDIGAS